MKCLKWLINCRNRQSSWAGGITEAVSSGVTQPWNQQTKSICCVHRTGWLSINHSYKWTNRVTVSSWLVRCGNSGSLSWSTYYVLGIVLSVSHAIGPTTYVLIFLARTVMCIPVKLLELVSLYQYLWYSLLELVSSYLVSLIFKTI